jgi:hypothetical protein
MATNFLKLAQEAFEASSAFVDANYRPDWDYSLRAFRNEHAAGSKYLSEEYKGRSRLFRPKTRTVIRKNEAAGAIALFSNMDIVNVTPGNPDDVMSVASAAAMKELLEYRLSRTIPAFPLVIGALQDAQTTGAVVSYQYWEYQRTKDGRVVKDKPCIELRPIENIRLDGGASWLDPVGTTPYFCDILPMYVCDVRAMMTRIDDKTGAPAWKKYKDDVIASARPESMDSTRKARLGNQQDPHDEQSGIKEFDVVWVMRWFMRDAIGDDYTFYTLGTKEMLTAAKPVEEVYFHGKRPYVMGYSIIETHKAMKSGLPVMVKPMQMEVNDIANQRLDNVKFVLNKRWIVARGRQTDVPSLVRNVPGGVTLTTDPNMDVKESNWPDVTSSSYVEHDRMNSEFDDLAGNFSPSTRVANNAVNDTLGGSRMAAQGAGLMSDYLIRTFIETWYEPVLRQVALLESYYETDEMILGVCANKARLFPRFGISRITDMMLMNEVNISVNVGMGSSNPNERMQKFLMATNAAIQIRLQAPPGANVEEMTKEIYSNAGYRDGARFFSDQQDPRLVKAMQIIQQLQAQLNGKGMELQKQAAVEQAKIASNEKVKAAELQVDQARIAGDLRIREAELAVEQQRIALERLKIEVDVAQAGQEHQAKLAEFSKKIEEAELKLEHERMKIAGLAAKTAADIAKAEQEEATVRKVEDNEKRLGTMAQDMTKAMGNIGNEMMAIRSALGETSAMVKDLEPVKQGIALIGSGMVAESKARRKAKGFTLKKGDDRKTKAVVVSYDDGSFDEMPVTVQ